MNSSSNLNPTQDIQSLVSAEEWQTRVDLAACYRLVALNGWDDLIYTHISARVPGDEDHFLMNPLGLMFEEITASSLVKIDLEGNKVMESPYAVNRAGFIIHSAIHEAREDAGCVLHLHTEYGNAVAMLEEGLLPLNQHAVLLWANMAYHEYEGVATRPDEKVRLVENLGDKAVMILRNHGTLTVGKSVAEAYHTMHFLERACKMQILAQSTGRPLHQVTEESIHNVAEGAKRVAKDFTPEMSPWPALVRKLDRIDSGFRD